MVAESKGMLVMFYEPFDESFEGKWIVSGSSRKARVKWHASLIDNPNYKGIWKPQEIPNPAYFELEKPDFEPIAAIGIEIWTMQDGILFDNILIASDEKVAGTYREITWKPKFEIEKEKLKAEEANAGYGISTFQVTSSFQPYLFVLFCFLVLENDCTHPHLFRILTSSLGAYKPKIIDLIEQGEKQPNITIGILASIEINTIWWQKTSGMLFGSLRIDTFLESTVV
ncbi:hypothetical protein SADUNF_Sadunf01G0051700 [Salix dunnii]|uniref:Uncharacterized protein n=1 Tax=Salix dunnii TaxID=1413687 RepID=A0A835N9U1_9ROSI|nr:hypothetical protein SADUNF_Sadunf01G0051700 [Salix dunnii]